MTLVVAAKKVQFFKVPIDTMSLCGFGDFNRQKAHMYL